MPVKPVPDGYHTVTPYLAVPGASKLLEFVKKAFGAEETECMRREDGTLMHAQVKIGYSMVMMGEPTGDCTPPMPAMLYLYVPDTDALYKAALAAGATSVMEPENMFYGDRNAGVKDPCGNMWYIATHMEDVSPEEMAKRAAEHAAKPK